jgi:hypothetical protein
MKKLKLEAIQVESYETSEIPTGKGTVEANAITRICPPTMTCPATCMPSCSPSDCASCQSSPYCC